MADIFISYASVDRSFARRLADVLEAHGWSVWWDHHNLRSGQHFDSAIEEAIHSARAVIVVWSKVSVESGWVRDEATMALEDHKLVPLRIDMARLPLRFRNIHTIDLASWTGETEAESFERLVKDLGHYLGPPRSLDRLGHSGIPPVPDPRTAVPVAEGQQPAETVHNMARKKKIGVVVDWERGKRHNGWEALLRKLDTDNFFPNEVTSYPLADLIVADPSRDLNIGFFVQDLDVLIINWDAANGDPEFGSHLTLRWLEHRRPEILLWIRDGKLLIIESQTVLSVPDQNAYDALAGTGELPVCGPEDPQNPLKQTSRMGGQCQKTRHAPNSNGFENLDKLESNAKPDLNHETLFPGYSARLLTRHINHINWNKILYRGWFRRVFPGMRSLPWVSIIKTTDRRGFLKNHSTMQVAKVGEGAIFATTMFLATTDQRKLVLAMLNCADKNTGHLPKPPSLIALFQKGWKIVLTGLGGIAGYLAGQYGLWVPEAVEAFAPGLPAPDQETFKSVIRVVFVPVGMALFTAAWYLLAKIKKWADDVIGY